MTFVQSIRTCLTKYATFQGRAARSEFWFFFLFNCIVGVVTAFVDVVVFEGASHTNLILNLALMLPSIAVTVRRLHDTDRIGWWYFLFLIPLLGLILLVVWFCQKGTMGSNRFGPDPLAFGAEGDTADPWLGLR